MTLILTLMVSMNTCFAVAAPTQSESDGQIFQARVYLAQGKVDEAKQLAGEIYNSRKDDARAQLLMAEVLEHEVQQEMSAQFSAQKDDNQERAEVTVAKLLERSNSLLKLKQYEEALSTAEQVFQYDPVNAKASRLIDDIRKQSLSDNNSNYHALSRVTEEEISSRLAQYRKSAKESVANRNWGLAAMNIRKILWLEPGDREALQLEGTIKEQLKNEKRKTL